MLSLNHIIHGVSIAIIGYLLMKYMELRIQHNDLRYMYDGLMASCVSGHHGNLQQLCRCSEGQLHIGLVQQSQTGARAPQFKREASHSVVGSDGTMSTQNIDPFSPTVSSTQSSGGHDDAEWVNPSEVAVDEFGRTVGHAGDGTISASVQLELSDKSSVLTSGQQLPPLDHRKQQSVQPSFTFSSNELLVTRRVEGLQGRHSVDGKTDIMDDDSRTASSVLDRTSATFETVNLSPYSTGQEDIIHNTHEHVFIGHSPEPAAQSDFYIGSQNGGFTEKTEQPAVTAGSFLTIENENAEDILHAGAEGTPSMPDKIETSFDEYDYDDWEEEEGEGEESQKPSLVRLPKQQLPHDGLDKLKDLKKLQEEGTSVECWGKTLSNRTCRFQNLCFNTKSGGFIFLRSKNSVLINVPKLKSNEPLLELSTVAGHNAQYFFYTEISVEEISQFLENASTTWHHLLVVPGNTVIFKRFKPDNIMHAFHDDIVPLFYTLQSLGLQPENSHGKFPISLFLADDNSDGEFFGLYDTFAGNFIFTVKSLTTVESEYLCFPEAHVGLSKDTTWYQYGFFEPQGPIQGTRVTSDHVRNVSQYLLNHFSSECLMCGGGGHLVLILRKETRRMLNEMELMTAISKELRLKVMTVSFESHSLSDMIPIIHTSRGIIGMHGSLLSLAVFLKRGSFLVELFPYAVNPARYTPYKTVCEIPGMGIIYRAWVNRDHEKSLPHPDWFPEFGGIQHLSLDKQDEITSQTEVPPHLCCEDPSWLYHIFQDTHVNIPEVLPLIKSALAVGEPLWVGNSQS